MGAFLITGVEFVSKRKKKNKVSAYTRNRNRIMQQIRRIAKRTGQAIQLFIPTEKQLRAQGITGHKLTSATAGLKAMKSKDLESAYGGYTKKFDPTTGEIFDNEPDFEPPFQPTGDLLLDRETIYFFDNFVSKFAHRDGGKLLRGWKNQIVSEFGEHAFAEMFRQANEFRPIKTEYQIYKGDVAQDWISTAMYYLPEGGPITRDKYEDAMDNILHNIREFDVDSSWFDVE